MCGQLIKKVACDLAVYNNIMAAYVSYEKKYSNSQTI